MNKYILLIISVLLLPRLGFAIDSYNFAVGLVQMPDIQSGSDHYKVEMQDQGQLLFKVTKIMPITSIAGIWLKGNEVFIFMEDGSYFFIDITNREAIDTNKGSYQVNDKEITLIVNNGSEVSLEYILEGNTLNLLNKQGSARAYQRFTP